MRDHYLPFFRARRPSEAAAPEPDGADLEAQIRAAFPSPALSDALRARVAETCRAAAAPEPRAPRLAGGRRRLWLRAAGGGLLVLAVAALVIPWRGSRVEWGTWGFSMPAPVAHGSAVILPQVASLPERPQISATGRPALGFFGGDGMQGHDETRAAHPLRLAGTPEGDGVFVGGQTSAVDAVATPLPGPGAPPTTALKPKTLTALQESRPDRYLIRNATLTVQVRDARQAARALMAAVGAAGGYVAESHESVDDLGQRSVVITVRVPFGRFDGSLTQVEALGKVLDKQVTAEDVTEEFVDSQARLHNLQQTEQRLRAHLGQAARLSDILLVENALSRVRGEIEQLEGRLRYLTHRIAYSTLAVTLSEAPRPQPVVPPEGYSGGKVAADAVRALVTFGQRLGSAAIWLAVWAIVWLPLAALAGLLYRRWVGEREW